MPFWICGAILFGFESSCVREDRHLLNQVIVSLSQHFTLCKIVSVIEALWDKEVSSTFGELERLDRREATEMRFEGLLNAMEIARRLSFRY